MGMPGGLHVELQKYPEVTSRIPASRAGEGAGRERGGRKGKGRRRVKG